MLASALASTYDVNLAADGGRRGPSRRGRRCGGSASFVGYPHADGAFTSGGHDVQPHRAARCARAGPAGHARHGARRPARRGLLLARRPTTPSCARSRSPGSAAPRPRALEIDDLRRMRAGRPRRGDRRRPRRRHHAGRRRRHRGHDAHRRGRPARRASPTSARATACGCTSTAPTGCRPRRTAAGRPLFAGLERADSVTLDAHKWLGVPKSCSVLLVRDDSALRGGFGHQERYMLHRDDAAQPGRPHARVLAAVPLAEAVAGAARARRRGLPRLDRAQHAPRPRASPRLLDADAAFELLHRPQLSALCFRHCPRPAPADLDEHNRGLAQAIQADGRVYLAPAVARRARVPARVLRELPDRRRAGRRRRRRDPRAGRPDQEVTMRAPREGANVIARRMTPSRRPAAARTPTERSTVRSTTFISNCAKLAPDAAPDAAAERDPGVRAGRVVAEEALRAERERVGVEVGPAVQQVDRGRDVHAGGQVPAAEGHRRAAAVAPPPARPGAAAASP